MDTIELNGEPVGHKFHEKVIKYTKDGETTVPQTCIGGQCRGGCADIMAAKENGNLWKWLDEAKVSYEKNDGMG